MSDQRPMSAASPTSAPGRLNVDIIPGEVLRDEREDDVGIVSFDECVATAIQVCEERNCVDADSGVR